MSKELPCHMISSHFVELEKLPLTHNGKIYIKFLDTFTDFQWSGDEYVGPRDDMERRLAALWCVILNTSNVGVRDDFMEIGGIP